MACDLETTQTAACTSGIGKLDNRIQLLRIIAQLMCEISEGGGGSVGYDSYVALLSQTGTNNPVVTELNNTVGSITWSRDSLGTYFGTPTDFVIDATKTYLAIMGSQDHSFGFCNMFSLEISSGTFVVSSSVNAPDTSDFVSSDGLLDGTSIEIRVYP